MEESRQVTLENEAAYTQKMYEECLAQIDEYETKLSLLLKKALSVSGRMAPIEEQYRTLKEHKSPVVSLQEFRSLSRILSEQKKISESVDKEMKSLKKDLRTLQTSILPARKQSYEAAKVRLQSYTNVVPFPVRGST